jgi:micrococcal nuclease
MYEYRARLIRCVDGDTADFEVDLGFKVFVKVRTRLLGVNTPERGKVDYLKATLMLESLIEGKADPSGYITIKTHKTGKYGRWLVEIDGVTSELAKIWPYVTAERN